MKQAISNLFERSLFRLALLLLLPIFCFFSFKITTSANASTLPETYPLQVSGENSEKIDTTLHDWFESHVMQADVVEMSKQDSQALMQKQDEVSRLYIKLARKELKPNDIGAQEEFAVLLGKIQKNVLDDPLLPYVLKELQLNGQTSVLTQAGVDLQKVSLSMSKSCAQYQDIFDRMESLSSTSKSDVKLELARSIHSYNSKKFRRQAFPLLISLLNENEDSALITFLDDALKENQDLLALLPWRQTDDNNESSEVKTLGLVDNVSKQLRKKTKSSCQSVTAGFFKELKSKKIAELSDALKVAEMLESCVRQFDRQPNARLVYWEKVQQAFEKSYGLRGWGEAQLEKAYFHWRRDDFLEAIALLEELQSKVSAKEPALEADALLTQGLIYENQSDYKLAVDKFEVFINRFPQHDSYQDALRRLVLIYSEEQRWKEALHSVILLRDQQESLAAASRSDGLIGFALFWQSRILFALDQKSEATKVLQHLVKEQYSTFYGAMGHYYLELISGQKYELEPATVPQFNVSSFFAHFNDSDQASLRRAEKLLELGQSQKAMCELDEVAFKEDDNNHLVTRTLFIHAAGKWLQAIKNYSALPRTFRNTLPRGFERILFPRKFDPIVEKYAKLESIDPDLVFALIRQESIFNPKAKSPAGAMGVMQIMPQTAVQLSKRIVNSKRSDNLSSDSARKIKRTPDMLYNPEININLGVNYLKFLLERYEQQPIFVLASYNAGEARLKKWLRNFPPTDLFAFIERIPYEETREYVKLVLRNYFYYKRMYPTAEKNLAHLKFVEQITMVNMIHPPVPPPSENVPVVPLAPPPTDPFTAEFDQPISDK